MADWAGGLCPQIMSDIFERLGLADYIRCTAVCRPWKSFLTTQRRCAAELPWLAVPHSIGGRHRRQFCWLYNLHEKREYSVPLPSPHTFSCRRCVGSSDGWLVVLDHTAELHMLNPLTGERIQLPSITTLPEVKPVRDPTGRLTHYRITPVNYRRRGNRHEHGEDHTVEDTIRTYHHKVVVSWTSASASSPSPPGPPPRRYTAVTIHGRYGQLAFAKEGAKSWTALGMHGFAYHDVVRHRGRFYAVRGFGEVSCVDLGGGGGSAQRPHAVATQQLQREGPRGERQAVSYLVESAGGDLLQVVRWLKASPPPQGLRTSSFEVFRLEDGGETGPWVQVMDLDGEALFLGKSYSISLSTGGVPDQRQLQGNCIYFTDGGAAVDGVGKGECRYDEGVYNMADGSIEGCCPRKVKVAVPPPVWFRPNLGYQTVSSSGEI